MKTTLKKAIALGCSFGMLLTFVTGCGQTPAKKTAANQVSTEVSGAAPSTDHAGETKGKWQVLDSETAAAVDADFVGEVRHIAEGAFSITETKVQILDDGSVASSSPSSNADILDSEIIHVVVDDDTYFSIRTIDGSGERHEDAEAGFGDLEENMSVEMRGTFENDVFYASEVRLIKIS